MAYIIEVNKRVVSYRAEKCEFEGTEDHECESDCTWMEGESRELETPTTSEDSPDKYDLELFDGSLIDWAVDYCCNKACVTKASSSPVEDSVPEHDWLHASDEDPYRGDSRVTETSVYLRGDWTDQQRAEVFRRATTFH